jgi:hypothetical protein
MRLKIKPEDYDAMLVACRAIRDSEPAITPMLYASEGRGKDPAVRFRWDLLRASGFEVCRLYDYLNDEHINSAMKAIVNDLYPNG